jgi:hypothetical protein
VDFILTKWILLFHSTQITEDLILRGINKVRVTVENKMVTKDVTQEKVRNRLNFLTKYNIISRDKFESDESFPTVRVYNLQYMAMSILKSRNISCGWRAGDSLRDIVTVKTILARNNLWNLHRIKVANIKSIDLHFKYKHFTFNNKVLLPDLMVTLNTETGSAPIIFDFVRNSAGFAEKLKEKFSMYKMFLSPFHPTTELSVIPRLVFVGEDDRHIYEVHKILAEATGRNDHNPIKILLTTDTRIMEENFDQLFLKIRVEDNDVIFSILNNKIYKIKEEL